MNILAVLTEQTCGEACWHAHEDICRCSCGGRNHGVLNDPSGKPPDRTRKMGKYRYTLHAVVKGYSKANYETETLREAHDPNYNQWAWKPNGDAGESYVKQRAGINALKWIEVQPFIESEKYSENPELYTLYHDIYLIWKLVTK